MNNEIEFPKVFIINLKRAKDRKKTMEEDLKKYDIPHEFIEAVDGNEIKVSDYHVDFDVYYKMRNKYLSKYEIACFKSY